ncbi:MAG: 30S ribosomal protein S16 [Planctomycetaceae bacterium]|nr:30S ribosomal protein S16 [Planctomycetaceae bacterium]
MAVRIRMKRMGRKHRPFYRICVMDSRKPRDGKAIEEVGTYDTSVVEKSQRVTLNLERIDYWMSVGAQPSENVKTLIKKVKTNKFGETKQPPKMQAPKQPEPEAPPEEESAEAPADVEPSADAPAEEAPKAEESAE